MRRWFSMACALWALWGCEKVPFVDVGAQFVIADATWFEEEETLFFFYRLETVQGLGQDSQFEVTYITDSERLGWTPTSQLAPVHTHLPVDCGPRAFCGSLSLRVRETPLQVGLRLRYHKEGALTRDASLNFNRVGSGPAHTNRSLIVYGVFDETNTFVQWRARHQFPAIRNEDAQALGLRREFAVQNASFGEAALEVNNPYGYGMSVSCPSSFVPWNVSAVETNERAVFQVAALPLEAQVAPHVCGHATVKDGKGVFTTSALAQKNPEVRPAFPLLRSPVSQNVPIQFLLKPCSRSISEAHLEFQKNRAQLVNPTEVCLDNVQAPNFTALFSAQIQSRVESQRVAGQDMVLVFVLHHDDATGAIQRMVENVLEPIVSDEGTKSSPRVAGVFLFDSFPYSLSKASLERSVLWCPPDVPFNDLDLFEPTFLSRCPIQPDGLELQLGPFRVTSLPILASRRQFLNFVDKYSTDVTGRVDALRFYAPIRTPISRNIEIGDVGEATFFNNERISALPDDAFSFCQSEDLAASFAVVKATDSDEVFPISVLPEWHNAAPQNNYELGLAWDFSFLTRMDYTTTGAIGATAFSINIATGISESGTSYYGTQMWLESQFSLRETLMQCTRFCNHPTFDSAGVYQVQIPFRQGYAAQCYRPKYPLAGQGGFPLDP